MGDGPEYKRLRRKEAGCCTKRRMRPRSKTPRGVDEIEDCFDGPVLQAYAA